MLGVPLRRPDASPVFCAALVEGLAKHVLYMHQQIPCTYDELERSVAPPPPDEDGEEEPVSRVRRPTMASRKAAKLVHALGELFALLPEALSQARAPDIAGPSAAGSTVAALMLGSSPAAPRIVILLRIFPLAAGVAGPSNEAEAAAAVRDGKLRVLRALTIQCGQLASVNPGLCRLHLLVQAPPDAPLPAAAFQPRPGLTLKLKRAHAVCVGVGGPASGCAVEPHEPPLRAQDWRAAPPCMHAATRPRPACNPSGVCPLQPDAPKAATLRTGLQRDVTPPTLQPCPPPPRRPTARLSHLASATSRWTPRCCNPNPEPTPRVSPSFSA